MKTEAVIDRFEEDKAVLLADGERKTVVLPKICLPQEAREGDYLTITIEIDEMSTRLAAQEADALLNELMNNDTK